MRRYGNVVSVDVSFSYFIAQVFSNPILAMTVLLTLGVIFVNGWTDAPNAIATCVTTRCLPPKAAIIMSAIFNFLGVFIMTHINASVASTISNMVDFGSNTQIALIALCAALFSIVVYSVGASVFGIPTSESHSLIAGLTGAAIALGGADGVNMNEWVKVLYGLVLSLGLGFAAGWGVCKIVTLLFANTDRRKSNTFFRWAQIAGAAGMSFMHGAQDGQKFIGVLFLGVAFCNGQSSVENMIIPVWLMLLCSVVMGVGTSVGGEKIIKSVGIDPVFFGVFWVITNEIALLTPPLGVNLFIAMNLSNLPLERVAKGAIPYIFLLILVVFFLIFFPDVVTFLPKALGMY